MSKKEIQARRFFVSGRVQGVGYRIFSQRARQGLGVTGYTRNRRDGRVEVFAMGTAEKLAQLRKELEEGADDGAGNGKNEEPATVDPQYQDEFSVEYTI